MVTQINIGSLVFEVDGTKKEMATSGGYLEVQQNNISIIAETAEWPEDIEINRAREAEQRARRRLENTGEDINMDRAKLALARALNRLKVASRI